ncbi:MAG TPA: ABC transporter permease [Candidatus Limnocylindrales bacterium]|jgi:peptide/nickel transport system permease protein
MTKFVIRRVIQAVPVLLGITIVVYAILLSAPGGPIAKYAQNPRITESQRNEIIKAWGLDQPIPVQYCRWMGFCDKEQDGLALVQANGVPNVFPAALGGGTNGVLHGDFGHSLETGDSVAGRIGKAALPTAILAGLALLIWVSLSVLIGTLAAIKRYTFFDNLTTVFSYVGFAMPTFWLGIMLIYAFSGPGLDILPASGMTTIRSSPAFGSDKYWDFLFNNPLKALGDLGWHLVLPVFTLVVVNIAGDSRFVRASMIESLSQDYVRTARAKGLPGRSVTFKHAFRNAMLPFVTNVGLEIPFLFTGAIVTETIFSWPGIGRLTIDATRDYDYPMLMGVLLVTSVLVVLANLIADVAYAVVDPRIKL